MKRLVKLFFKSLLVLALVIAAAAGLIYVTLFASPGEPSPDGYSFDIDEVRRLADAMPSERPIEIRVETVASFQWPQLFTMAGGSLSTVRMGCFAYQLVTLDGHYIIDTAMDSEIAATLPNTTFFENAYDRMQAAIGTADVIAVTHEHPDHLGGITKHPDVKALHGALRLTHDQIADPERHDSPRFPEGALDGYEPLQYDTMTAIAPGVVLIESAGHTHGSQMVFIALADGTEVLLLGDVAWMLANVTEASPRPEFVSRFVLPGGEDRARVLSQLQFLRQLSDTEPGMILIPGHDMNVMRELLASGVLKPMFQVTGSGTAADEAAEGSSDTPEPSAAPDSDAI